MATLAVPARTVPSHTAEPGIWLPAISLWQREIVRFYRQKARVVGVIASPLLFWLVLGSGFAHTFSSGSANSGASSHYFGFFFRDRSS